MQSQLRLLPYLQNYNPYSQFKSTENGIKQEGPSREWIQEKLTGFKDVIENKLNKIGQKLSYHSGLLTQHPNYLQMAPQNPNFNSILQSVGAPPIGGNPNTESDSSSEISSIVGDETFIVQNQAGGLVSAPIQTTAPLNLSSNVSVSDENQDESPSLSLSEIGGQSTSSAPTPLSQPELTGYALTKYIKTLISKMGEDKFIEMAETKMKSQTARKYAVNLTADLDNPQNLQKAYENTNYLMTKFTLKQLRTLAGVFD